MRALYSALVRDALLRWYDANRRDLPWRRTRDPYRVWVSEVMLQQTRVDVVVPYYQRFVARFPDVGALADAPLEEVLALWSGLGYYARARNLHAAAREIAQRHGGALPSREDALRALPGFGRYTTGAVLSIAFDRPAPIVDGNVARVLSRLRARALDAREQWSLAAELVRGERPGDFNQALMELGATICTPRSPRCGACPLQRVCTGRDSPEQWPAPRARPDRAVLTWACALAERGGRLLFARRPERGLFGGLWELPAVDLANGDRAEAALARALERGLGVRAHVGAEAARVSQTLTHRELTVVAYRAKLSGRLAPRGWQDARWVAREDVRGLGLASVTRKLLARTL